MTVTEALGLFLTQLEADGRSIHTRGQYARHVRLLISWLGDEPINSINHEDLAQFLSEEGATLRADGRPKKATSLNTLRSSLKVFFAYVHRAGYITEDPSRLIRRAICSPPPPRALNEDEQQRLLCTLEKSKDFEGERDHHLIRLMLGTGIRLSSALAIQVEDVDLGAREIEIRTAKGNAPDRVIMSRDVAEKIGSWIQDNSSGVLFPRRDGESITARHAQRRFRQWIKLAGITRKVSPHSCRHSFAMRVLERSQGDLTLVQAAMKHKSIASTMVYLRVNPDRLRKVIG